MTKEIQLTQGYVALVDDEDYEYINSYKWHVSIDRNKKYYAKRNANNKCSFSKMHRLIMNAPKELFVDHIDGNGLNNQKSNLRLCNNSENLRNRGETKNSKSGYKGVHLNRGLWRAKINVNKKTIHLGYSKSKEEAARIYDEGAKKYHGIFAKRNFNE